LKKFYFYISFYDDLGFILGSFWKIAVSGINLPDFEPILAAPNPVKIRFVGVPIGRDRRSLEGIRAVRSLNTIGRDPKSR
jgi:hypothetical protein